jgi:hypothetical protein
VLLPNHDSHGLVLLPGFQKGRDIKASQGKEQGAVLAKKKCNLRHTMKKLKNSQNFTPFWVNKMFSLKFNTFKTLQVAP